MNFLITGSGGFVGGHLIKEIKNRFPKANVIGLHRNPINQKINNVKYVKVDLNDLEAVVKTFRLHKPDYVIHLAAESSVNYSWENPANSLENNLNIYLNVLEALRKLNFFPKILSVGSSEVYGAVRKAESLLPLLILTDCELVEGVSINKNDLDKASAQLKGAISLVHGIKKGDIGFNPKEKDEDWEFYKK